MPTCTMSLWIWLHRDSTSAAGVHDMKLTDCHAHKVAGAS